MPSSWVSTVVFPLYRCPASSQHDQKMRGIETMRNLYGLTNRRRFERGQGVPSHAIKHRTLDL